MREKQLIIAIGREFGSGGHEIAQRLADYYGVTLYDQNILKKIANERELDDDSLMGYDESHRKVLISRTVRGLNSSPEHNIANLQFEFLKQKAEEKESFVVVGRCAETVLKPYAAMIPIFIIGDKDKKRERIAKLYDLSLDKAEKRIADTDKKRKQYHNSHCQIKWGDSRNYDISINSSKLGINGCVELLIDYIKKREAQSL